MIAYLLCIGGIFASLCAMELPFCNQVPSLKLLALKQVYSQEKKGRYTDDERACIGAMLQQEGLRQFLTDIVDERMVRCDDTDGCLVAYAAGMGLIRKAGFWSHSAYSLVEYPSCKKLYEFDHKEYLFIESPCISPDGRYCVGKALNLDNTSKLFVVDSSGKKVFSCTHASRGKICFVTNSCFFICVPYEILAVDLGETVPQLRTIIVHQQADDEPFSEVRIVNGEYCVVRARSRIFVYKGSSIRNWKRVKTLKYSALKAIAVAQTTPLFAQISYKRSKNNTSCFASFYSMTSDSVEYMATCLIADCIVNTPHVATFFVDDRYFACTVSFKGWFNDTRIRVVDRLHQGGSRVVQDISIDCRPERLFCEGLFLYAPGGAQSTDVFALNNQSTDVLTLNNWIRSQDQKSESKAVVKNDLFSSCTLL